MGQDLVDGRCEDIEPPVEHPKAGLPGQLDILHNRPLTAVEDLESAIVEGIRLVLRVQPFEEGFARAWHDAVNLLAGHTQLHRSDADVGDRFVYGQSPL